MSSTHLAQLREQIDVLERHLLPSKFDATGTYEDRDAVTVRTLAFVVLAHAEIESYFENRIIEIAKAAWQSWKEARHLSRVACALLAFCGREMNAPPESLSPPKPEKAKEWLRQLEIGERLKLVVQEFVYAVTKHNHGIREKNLLAMLLPVGVYHADLDATFIADIDSFGKRRGEAAHSSSSRSQVQQEIDPKTEQDRVLDLISSLERLDEELDYLLDDACARTKACTAAVGGELEHSGSLLGEVPLEQA